MNFTRILNKLSSRKFWALVAALAVSILTMFNCDENTGVQITSLITTFGSVVAYIIGESVIDKEKVKKENSNDPEK